MDAQPLLYTLARVLDEHSLEAVLIGNAAAGDFNFLFRGTSSNLRRLKAITVALHATLWKAYYPPSDRFRIMRDEDGLQVNFDGRPGGANRFEELRGRARRVNLAGYTLLVDRRVHLRAVKPRLNQQKALKLESERAQIQRHLALPMEKRTNFLRKRIGFQASCL